MAGAAEPTWPPPDDVATRMRELQAVLSSADASAAQREAARHELSSLLKSPAGQARGPTPGEKPTRPARAAIEPFGSFVKPAPNPPISVPGVAHVEVTVPPRMTISPPTGRPVAPSVGAAVDPRTGHILHETPNGYIDPRTGAFVPK